jgi:hypothetical protein
MKDLGKELDLENVAVVSSIDQVCETSNQTLF